MAARQYQINVGTSAIILGGTQYRGWILLNNSSAIIYLGDADVLTTTGFPVAVGAYFSPGEIVHTQLSEQIPEVRLYAIAGSASNDVRVLVPGRV